MYHYFEAITNTSGDALIGYFVRLLDAATGMVVPIYADDNSTPISVVSGRENMAATDSSGNVSFFVVAGTYNLDIYASDGTTFLKRVPTVPMTSQQGAPGAKGDQGDPGPAIATYATLAAFKAASIGNKTQFLQDPAITFGQFNWETANAPYTADDVNIIKADSTALSVGAWVRQSMASVTFVQTGAGSAARQGHAKLLEAPLSTLDKGASTGPSADQTAAFVAAKAVRTMVKLPASIGATALFNAPNAATFTGAQIDADPGVTVSVPGLSGDPAAQYSTLAAMSFARATSVALRDVNITTMFPADPNPYAMPQMPPMEKGRRWTQRAVVMNSAAIKLRRTAWTPTNDTWTDVTPTDSGASTIAFTSVVNNFVVGFTAIGVGETVHMGFFSRPSVSNAAIGVFVRGTNGSLVIYDLESADGTGLAYYGAKPLGGSFSQSQNVNYPNRTINAVFRFANALFSVKRIDRDRVTICMNGQPVARQFIQLGSLGDIQEVGLGYYTPGTTGTVVLADYIIERSDEFVGAIDLTGGILFAGDSTVETLGASNWTNRVPELLHTAGLQCGIIYNFGVVSTTSAQCFTAIQNAFTGGNGAYVVGICTGTNDIQAQTDRATFTATWTNGLQAILDAGRKPFVMIPYIWYRQADAGGTGYATSNGELGAWYRQEIMRICVSKGVRFADPCQELGNPWPNLRLDPRGGYQLRDNIHQTPGKGHALYARTFARMLLSEFAMTPAYYASSLWDAICGSGVTPVSGAGGIGFDQDATGRLNLWGLIDATTVTDGTVLLNLPRHLWPGRTVAAYPMCFTSGGSAMLSPCRVDVSASDGTVKLYAAPATTARISLETIAYVPAP